MSNISNSWDLAFNKALATPPADATYLARSLPKLPKQVFPEKMPSWSKEVVTPPLLGVSKYLLKENLIPTLRTAFDRIDKLKMGLEYMNPIPYDNLVNEAVNRAISKH